MASLTGVSPPTELDEALAAERAGLVRLCARLTGDPGVAEDLAQEALLEAWRNGHKLRVPQARAHWLAGIARNVCLRWARAHGRERARLARAGMREGPSAAEDAECLVGDVDLELELERDELVRLLDKALALLPADTRAVLVARYVEGSPHAEIAAQLGLSAKAVSMRLTRGKLLLRRTLSTDLRQEAAPYGLAAPADAAGWQETRIWCSNCGQRRLLGRFATSSTSGYRELSFCCPRCTPDPADICEQVDSPELFEGINGYKAARSRLATWIDRFYRPRLADRTVPCLCGQAIPFQRGPLSLAACPPSIRNQHGLYGRCAACGGEFWQGLPGLALSLPEGRRFSREHPRIHMLPERQVEAAGRAAIITSYESVTGQARLDVISARDTYELLGVHGAPDR